jgi:hypothetical protein
LRSDQVSAAREISRRRTDVLSNVGICGRIGAVAFEAPVEGVGILGMLTVSEQEPLAAAVPRVAH